MMMFAIGFGVGVLASVAAFFIAIIWAHVRTE